MWGDPHFKSFNQLGYDFQGKCTYVLSERINTEDCDTRVHVKQFPTDTGSASVAREMIILIGDSRIRLMPDKQITVCNTEQLLRL